MEKKQLSTSSLRSVSTLFVGETGGAVVPETIVLLL